jgi:hypothetical protein
MLHDKSFRSNGLNGDQSSCQIEGRAFQFASERFVGYQWRVSAEAGESTPLAREEYRALRTTIRERGTARVLVAVVTVVAWAALSIAGFDRGPAPFVSVITLLVLAAGFEAVAALHIGVERVGRYLQSTYERAGTPRWEHVVARAPFRRLAGQDGTFSLIFLVAALVNLLPLTQFGLDTQLSPDRSTPFWTIAALMHLAFALRVVQIRRFSRLQHSRDLQALESK